jgi:glutathione S-transferase
MHNLCIRIQMDTPMPTLKLISHPLCPYVQRAAIALSEKAAPFERIQIDLADKPDWFLALSPTGKVPVLLVGDQPIFESAVILEYLEDTVAPALHPADPVRRADHRAWIEFGSAILADIAGLYSARDEPQFEAKRVELSRKFGRLEARLLAAPWFDGEAFSLVDAVFGPIFRYFDAFDRIAPLAILDGLQRVARWRQALATRPSVHEAAVPDYAERLDRFLAARASHLSGLMRELVA